jgi:cytochrome c peroxidase
MHKKHFIFMAVLIACIYACNRDIVAHTERFKGFQQPEGFPSAVYDFANNPVTKNGFELGRKLFYDPMLSSNNTVSCSSCHVQKTSFTQPALEVSCGIYNREGTRNVMPVMNLAWNTSFMWDGGVFDLDLQPIVPITGHTEMADSLQGILARLRADKTYPVLFKEAFGKEGITTSTLVKALSQFMVMCVSSNSKYDSVMRKRTVFTADEQKGYLLFKEKCSGCHSEPLFTDGSFRNTGLGAVDKNDPGRYLITLNDTDKYKFKVPSLRNVGFTGPYMHDGSLRTLDDVLDYYASGIKDTTGIDRLLKENTKAGIAINKEQKQDMIAFLKTLDDNSFLSDKDLSQ